MDRQLKRARIAHHEAAHAVIGRALGLTVTRVRIRRGGGAVSLGEADLDSYDADQAAAELRFFYAGMFADARLLTEHGYPRGRALRLAKPHAAHDLRQVRSIAAWMRRHHRVRLNTRRAERDVARLVDRHWNAITRMAHQHL